MCGAGRCDKHGFTSGWLMSTLSVQGCYHVNWDALALGSPSLPRLRCFVHSSLAGWHWNALQSPPALHFCFTPNHVGDGSSNGKQQTDVVQQLLEALRAGVATLMANPDAVQGGSAP
eukprot:scaffold55669_cov20-Tisochrysis_lutea.AAC.1